MICRDELFISVTGVFLLTIFTSVNLILLICQNKREAELQDLTIHGQLQALQHREQDELKAALRKYGTEVDGGFEVHFEGEQPIVAGYLFDEPRDIVIDAARLDADGNLSLLGEDKEVRDGQYDIEPSDIFGGQLDYVTSSIGAWMK